MPPKLHQNVYLPVSMNHVYLMQYRVICPWKILPLVCFLHSKAWMLNKLRHTTWFSLELPHKTTKCMAPRLAKQQQNSNVTLGNISAFYLLFRREYLPEKDYTLIICMLMHSGSCQLTRCQPFLQHFPPPPLFLTL